MQCKKVVIFGGDGGGSNIAMAMLEASQNGYNEMAFHGFINDKDGVESIAGFPVIGGKKDIPRLISEGYLFIKAVQKIDGQKYRVDLFESFGIPESQLATFVHPKAYVAPNASIGPGCVVMPNASVLNSVEMGKCVLVFPGATISHHCMIDDHGFFAARSCIGSYCTTNRAVYCGYNCTIGQRLTLGQYSLVGMGAVVCKDVKPFEVVVGNPAKPLRVVKDKFDHEQSNSCQSGAYLQGSLH